MKWRRDRRINPTSWMNLQALVLGVFLLEGCVSQHVRPTGDAPPPILLAQDLLNAQKDLNHGRIEKARQTADQFLKSQAGASADQRLALFIRAQAEEATAQMQAAISDFRAVLALTPNSNPQDQAFILYRLLNCYQGLDQPARSLALLQDLESRKDFLPYEISQLEIPARYATLYVDRGQIQEAEKYYRLFSDHLAQPAPPPSAKPSARPGKFAEISNYDEKIILPRLLYNIGHTSGHRITREEIAAGYPALQHTQEFLLKSLAASDNQWSLLAANELVGLYKSALAIIVSTPTLATSDPLVGELAQQRMTKKLSVQMLGRLEELKLLAAKISHGKVPDTGLWETLWTQLNPLEIQLEGILSARPLNENLTEEALRRQGTKREGRVFDPKARLEKPPAPVAP